MEGYMLEYSRWKGIGWSRVNRWKGIGWCSVNRWKGIGWSTVGRGWSRVGGKVEVEELNNTISILHF